MVIWELYFPLFYSIDEYNTQMAASNQLADLEIKASYKGYPPIITYINNKYQQFSKGSHAHENQIHRSDFFKTDVLEKPEQAVVPELDSGMQGDSPQLCGNNVCQTLQVLLPSRDPFQVQLAQFEEAEQGFNWGSGI